MVEVTPTIVFVIILISVPLQFYLSPSSIEEANYYVHSVIKKIKGIYDQLIEIHYFDVNGEFAQDVTKEIDEIIGNEEDISDEANPETTSYFGGSQNPRDPRPPHVKYHVGQVIRHKIYNYRAVIILWDEKGKAPDWWVEQVHGSRTRWKELPNYTVAIDTRDRLIPQIVYVTEEDILPSEGVVIHPLIKHYFERLGPNGRYYMRPWHQKIYPYG